jgi:hypothetical protein
MVILADKHVLVNENSTLWCKKLKFAKEKSISASHLETDFECPRTEQNPPRASRWTVNFDRSMAKREP